MEASRLRSRYSIDSPLALSPSCWEPFRTGASGRSGRGMSLVPRLRQSTMTGPGGRFCAGLLTLRENFSGGVVRIDGLRACPRDPIK